MPSSDEIFNVLRARLNKTQYRIFIYIYTINRCEFKHKTKAKSTEKSAQKSKL